MIASILALMNMKHRRFKDQTYEQFARVGQALASAKRLELIDLLAQAPRHVEALAKESGMPVANVSQHLQVLHSARLVESEKAGTRTVYRLAGSDVLSLWLLLRSVAATRLAEVPHILSESSLDLQGTLPREELQPLLDSGQVMLLDVRPELEYESGHLPGAVSIPIEQLSGLLNELPRDKTIVTYCRGAYCLFADEAVELLRRHGFDARRLEGGWPEWWMEGRAILS